MVNVSYIVEHIEDGVTKKTKIEYKNTSITWKNDKLEAYNTKEDKLLLELNLKDVINTTVMREPS